jgi:site-specific DNA-methyltransferase (adenine-specific)
MGAIIWQKVTTCHTTGGATVMGSYPYPRNGIIKLDYEFILVFKKHGQPPTVKKEIKEKSRLTPEEWNQYFAGHWTFPGEKQSRHLAVFPEELPRRLIKMFSFVGDTVLDPFLGSGTTSLAARNLSRNSIGYEINEDFLPIIEKRLALTQRTLFQGASFEITRQKKPRVNVEKRTSRLPYIFKDPIRFDKKVDPRRLKFGSRIDDSSDGKTEYFGLQKAISPEVLVLKDGLRIRLLGVKEIPKKSKEALEFIRKKTKGHRLFMRFEDERHDADKNLLCYLYLQNKTFLNAHLIKSGLVDVDTSFDYRHKRRFLEYKRQAEK